MTVLTVFNRCIILLRYTQVCLNRSMTMGLCSHHYHKLIVLLLTCMTMYRIIISQINIKSIHIHKVCVMSWICSECFITQALGAVIEIINLRYPWPLGYHGETDNYLDLITEYESQTKWREFGDSKIFSPFFKEMWKALRRFTVTCNST